MVNESRLAETLLSELVKLFDSLVFSKRFFNCCGEEGIGGKLILDTAGVGGVVSSATQENIERILNQCIDLFLILEEILQIFT